MNDRNKVNNPSGSPLHIAVIGAGPVGSLFACYLARRGPYMSLYEYRENLRKTEEQHGKSVNLAISTRGRAALSKLGIEGHALPLTGRMIHNLKGSSYSISHDAVNNQFLLDPNYLHIWPINSFMMIFLPSQDKSWTVTLFMPFKMFSEINSPISLLQLFRKTFFILLIGDATHAMVPFFSQRMNAVGILT